MSSIQSNEALQEFILPVLGEATPIVNIEGESDIAMHLLKRFARAFPGEARPEDWVPSYNPLPGSVEG